MTTPSDPSSLLAELGLDPSLPRIDEALTHASFVNEHPGSRDYERLEFLGDAVLGLCISELLLEQLPGAAEGRLTRARAALVNTEALAAFARSVDLVSYVRFGKGAAHDALQSKVLADVVESIVAVTYLHGGLEAAGRLARRIAGNPASVDVSIAARDPKSQFQELVQGAGKPAPVYRVIGIEGPDHDRWFEVEVEVAGAPCARGRGRTKKAAEREAARRALQEAIPSEENPS